MTPLKILGFLTTKEELEYRRDGLHYLECNYCVLDVLQLFLERRSVKHSVKALKSIRDSKQSQDEAICWTKEGWVALILVKLGGLFICRRHFHQKLQDLLAQISACKMKKN